HFPSENAALKCVYLAMMSLDPTGAGRKRWTTHWKRALQAFDIAFDGRLTNNQIRAQKPTQLHRNLYKPLLGAVKRLRHQLVVYHSWLDAWP
ncbi:hypothetical protein ACFXPW_08290, partial [Streptomyces goshikiensis]